MATSTIRLVSQVSHSRAKSISFVGLGRMGSEMAYNLFSRRLAEAQEVQFVVCDAMPEAAIRFADNFRKQFPGANITIASTPEEATLASGTIVTMLPSSPHVRQVYLNSSGVIPTLRSLPAADASNTLCIDSTTLDVQVGRDVAAEAQATGAEMLDAPVSGGVTGAKAGTLSFLVGGSEQSFTHASPILALWICNNLILGVEQIVVAEAMLLGQRLGLDPAVLASVINSSTGACWSSSVNNPVPGALSESSPPCERNFEGGFATALMIKDLGLATNVLKASGSSMPLAEGAEDIYADAVKRHPELSNKDFSSIYRYLEKAMKEGRSVRLRDIEERV
ncbi:NAD binding domain of 6-phosphogluconate dehydrogenase-domain-containing protein [Multifurca ochricompacta]|uniref:3-hydroxyisobutyrate dehydrogenase n=1 Tax=Multifurca ochricompacta TaxID=376703 RepID=A0AAD4MBE2_9AGAM|nr:NAD binding domain of 6-phosphogluconate dehydrogenase-domain-containing protein [Multifurca ochricompacta]